MKCPFCGSIEDKVIDSRTSKEGDAIRRRRECLRCGKRFTSYERVEDLLPEVVKKDGRRESFDRIKILTGLKKACEKRPIGTETLDKETYNLYMSLIESGKGVAVAEAKKEVCQGCNMNIPPQLFVEIKSNEEILQCPQCHRILYFKSNS